MRMKKLSLFLAVVLLLLTLPATAGAAFDFTPVLGGQDPANITETLDLSAFPETQWTSSNPERLLIGEGKAYVLPGPAAEDVVLTAVSGGVPYTKTLTIAAAPEVKYLIDEDFSDVPVTANGSLPSDGNWKKDATFPEGYQNGFVGVVGSGTDKYLRLSNTVADDVTHSVAHAFFSNAPHVGKLTLEFDINPRSGNYSNMWPSGNSSETISGSNVFVRLPAKPGSVVVQGLKGTEKTLALTSGWHTFKLTADLDAKKFDFEVDAGQAGAQKMTNIAARDDATIIQQMNFGYARENTGESWIDNVKVYFDPMAALQLSVDQLAVGDPNSASGNILLSTGALDGATVDWISSRPDVVTNSGRVTRQETATEVTMTAIVQNYGAAVKKEFIFTVPARITDPQLAVNADAASLYFDTVSPLTQSTLNLYTQGPNGTQIKWTSTDGSLINPVTGQVKFPTTKQGKYYSVTLTAEVSMGEASKTETFTFRVPEASNVYTRTDDNRMDDQTFFGTWNALENKWGTPGKLNYAYSAALKPVEDSVKAGDYDRAREELFKYYKNKPASEKPNIPASGNKLSAQITAEEMLVFETAVINVWKTKAKTNGEMNKDYFNVRSQIADGTNCFILQALKRDNVPEGQETVVHFATQDSGTKPYLEVTQKDGEKVTLYPSDDTYIRGGSYRDKNYGAETEMLVSEGAGGPLGNTTRQAHFKFDLSSIQDLSEIKDARLYLYSYSDVAGKEVAILSGVENVWDESSLTMNSIKLRVISFDGVEGGYDWAQPAGRGAHDQFYNVQVRLYHISNLFGYANQIRTADPVLAQYYTQRAIDQYVDFVRDNGGLAYDSYHTGEKALNAGFRGNSYSVNCFSAALNSDEIDTDAFMSLIKLMWQEPDALCMPSNIWTSHNAAAFQIISVMNYIKYFPEFADASVWEESVQNRLSNFATEMTNDDGTYVEATSGYDISVLGTFTNLYKTAKELGITITQDFEDGYKAYAKAEMDLTRPDGKQWDWGDGGASATRPTIKGVADALGENGPLRYFGTNGAEGTVPEYTSVFYPAGKLASLRTGWDANSVSAFIIGRIGGTHAHSHTNHIGIYAYGRYLLADTGMASYDSSHPWFNWQRNRKISHNTVEIDGKGPKSGKTTVSMEQNDGMDFYDCTSTENANVPHTRKVTFIKDRKFFIVSDFLESASGTHTYTQNWHHLASANPSVMNASKNIVKTNYATGANLEIVPVDSGEYTLTMEKGVGMNDSAASKSCIDTTFASYKQEKTGNTKFNTILFPSPNPITKEIVTNPLTVTSGAAMKANSTSAFTMVLPDNTNAVYYVNHDPKAACSFGEYQANAAMAYLEENYFTAAKADLISKNGEVLFRSTKALSDITVQNGSKLEIETSAALNLSSDGLCIRSDATTVTLNGAAVAFKRSGSYILIGNYTAYELTNKSIDISGAEYRLGFTLATGLETTDVTAYAAVKDADGRVLRVYTADKAVAKDAPAVFSMQIPKTAEDNCIDLYIWESGTLIPLVETTGNRFSCK